MQSLIGRLDSLVLFSIDARFDMRITHGFLPGAAAISLGLIGSPALTGLGLGSGVALLVASFPAQVLAQSAEAVAKEAQAITVRIEGATQGSGVLMKKEGNRYTVLTAWHVVSGHRPGEELAIFTPDGKQHQLEQGSIRRLGKVDLAILSFNGADPYRLAQVGDVKSLTMGSPIYVAGFPLATTAVNQRILRLLKGDVIANASVAIDNGYQLLYSNQTLPGMSGGAVVNTKGQLVGIHGRSETSERRTEQDWIYVKTGTNQAVPISYYQSETEALSDATVVAPGMRLLSADDYLAKIEQLLGKGETRVGESLAQKVFLLASQSLALRANAMGYAYRGYAKVLLLNNNFNNSAPGDYEAAIADLNRALALNPKIELAYKGRGFAKDALSDAKGAIDDYSQALTLNPRDAYVYKYRGDARLRLGEYQGAIADYNLSLSLRPRDAEAIYARGEARYFTGDLEGACSDSKKASAIATSMNISIANFSGHWCSPP